MGFVRTEVVVVEVADESRFVGASEREDVVGVILGSIAVSGNLRVFGILGSARQ